MLNSANSIKKIQWDEDLVTNKQTKPTDLSLPSNWNKKGWVDHNFGSICC